MTERSPFDARVPLYVGGDVYAGGQAYVYFPGFVGAGFQARSGVDLNFRLSGTPVNATSPTPGASVRGRMVRAAA